MQNLKLHIVSFTIPFPVDYGGLFDIYYSIKALKQCGVKIHLHCIQYGKNQRQPILERYCEKVDYYPRKKLFPIRFWGKPYIVESRIIPEMIAKINEDNAPVLIEGIHGTGIISYLKNVPQRNILVRLHNAEYIYYRQLALTTDSWWQKIYYWSEYRRLRTWEQQLVKDNTAFCTLSLLDEKIYWENLGASNIHYIPLFIPVWKLKAFSGSGDYCLYHGNLDIAENQTAVRWLIEEVFQTLDIALYIAGKSSGSFVRKMQRKWPKIHWIENPTEKNIQRIIHNAQVHLLPSFNATGIKIKLLNALYNGRYCVVNSAMVADTGLETLVIVANTASEFRKNIQAIFQSPFPEAETNKRKQLLETRYDNEKNVHLLLQLLYAKPREL